MYPECVKEANVYPGTTLKDSVGPDPAYLSRAIPRFTVGVVVAVAGGAVAMRKC